MQTKIKERSSHPQYRKLFVLSKQLLKLEKKLGTFSKKQDPKYLCLKELYTNLAQEFSAYAVASCSTPNYDFNQKTSTDELTRFQSKCREIFTPITTGGPLEIHRGVKQLLFNIMLSIGTLCVLPVYYKYRFGEFFPREKTRVTTDSEIKVDELRTSIATLGTE